MASSFNKILQSITAIKLQELDHSDAFQSHAHVLAEAKATPNPVAKVELLRKAAVSCGPLSNTAVKCVLDLDNLESWIRQAQQDPAFEKANLERWADTLETHIRQANMRFDCGRLFGDLFKEWIASGDSALGTTASEHGNASIWYVNVGRKEKQEQLDRFKSFMFDEKSVDTKALLSYLNNVFSDKDARKKLEKIRGDIKNFCDETMDYTTIKKYEVVEVIDAFLSGQGSISDDNLTALTELRQNDTLLTELADVLTMRLASIGTWSWPAEGVPVQMRRHLNGKYTHGFY
ncbi:hypothetical protein F5887DRAFT_1070757 [Amanita rubescens]|nr:hypothetical protein F5887DRAFT_1070757 [Amanita rubescens]